MTEKVVDIPELDIGSQVRRLGSRISFIEERYNNFDSKLKQLQKNVVAHHRESLRLVRDLDKQVLHTTTTIERLTDTMKTLRDEILIRASKEDVATIQKYVDIWNPFEFVTQDQVATIVEDAVTAKRKKKR